MKQYIITCECFNPFCPIPAKVEGYDSLDTAINIAKKVVNDLSTKKWMRGRSVTVYDTINTSYKYIKQL